MGYSFAFGDLPAALVPFKPSSKFNNSCGDSKISVILEISDQVDSLRHPVPGLGFSGNAVLLSTPRISRTAPCYLN